ncbi:hypothetical protein ONE63_003563 [Megalurothrips usitatus]|uniref:Uncharacterized protein n=1 Tax=Megalurothrips usitatus TaxID=439358 RepID=A0AAV7X9W2_9NEOP|nr:hypothetical protein ONE63_003563 [Megalurothrips usitatus]
MQIFVGCSLNSFQRSSLTTGWGGVNYDDRAFRAVTRQRLPGAGPLRPCSRGVLRFWTGMQPTHSGSETPISVEKLISRSVLKVER